MMMRKICIPIFVALCISSCQNNASSSKSLDVQKDPTIHTERQVGVGQGQFSIDKLTFDARFDGGRLHGLTKLNDNTYRVYSAPYAEPVNKSPYFAFKIVAEKTQYITIEFDYLAPYTHRYIPKLSKDGKQWTPIDTANLITTAQGKVQLKLTVDSVPLWVAAQEVITSADMNQWIADRQRDYPYLTTEVVGKSSLGKPITALNSISDSSQQTVVLIARQHPPEVPGGFFGFQAFFNTVMGDTPLAQQFRKQFNILTIPLVNPDGADMGNWRHNAKGIDLNRDWINFSQPETQAIRDYVTAKANDGTQIVFGIDFHTSYSGPYFLIYEDKVYAELGHDMTKQWVAAIEKETQQNLDDRIRPQKHPYAYNWFYRTFKAEAITYEDGDEVDRQEIKRHASIYAQHFMKTLINNTTKQ